MTKLDVFTIFFKPCPQKRFELGKILRKYCISPKLHDIHAFCGQNLKEILYKSEIANTTAFYGQNLMKFSHTSKTYLLARKFGAIFETILIYIMNINLWGLIIYFNYKNNILQFFQLPLYSVDILSFHMS